MRSLAILGLAVCGFAIDPAAGSSLVTVRTQVRSDQAVAQDTIPVTPPDTIRSPLPIGLVLGLDTLVLPGADSAVRHDLWLGAEFERAGRDADAEAAYLRVLPKGSTSARAYAQRRIEAIHRSERARWVPWPIRPAWVWFSDWAWAPEAAWALLLGYAFLLYRRTVRKGKTQLRVQPFTRNLPTEVGVGIEQTIADFYRRTRQGSALGILMNSGLRIPIMSTEPSSDVIEIVAGVGLPTWIPQILRVILKSADQPRFVIKGQAEGTLWSVRIALRLEDKGKLVQSWDRTIPYYQLIERELDLACEVIYALSECPP